MLTAFTDRPSEYYVTYIFPMMKNRDSDFIVLLVLASEFAEFAYRIEI